MNNRLKIVIQLIAWALVGLIAIALLPIVLMIAIIVDITSWLFKLIAGE